MNGLTTGIGSFTTFSEVAFKFKVGWPAIACGMAFAALIGAVGGFLPAVVGVAHGHRRRDAGRVSVDGDLQRLRIDKQHKAVRAERARWPWAAGVAALLLLGGVGWRLGLAAAVPAFEVVRVRLPTGCSKRPTRSRSTPPGTSSPTIKIELASKVVGRVAWVGVEMGDRIKPGQVLVRLEDDEYKAPRRPGAGPARQRPQAKLAELKAGSRPAGRWRR